ncbi:MAG: hypothetical protein WBC22_12100 [Sedimentisphaerales bacterium]
MKVTCPFCRKIISIEGLHPNPDAQYVCPYCSKKLGRLRVIFEANELAPVCHTRLEPQDSHDDYFVDFIATELKKDINSLIELGIKLDKGQLAAKTGGVAWAGYEAFTGDWLSALVVGGISMLAGGLTNGYKRIKLMQMKQKWTDHLSDLSQDQLNYLVAGLENKYPMLLRSFQGLLQAGQ